VFGARSAQSETDQAMREKPEKMGPFSGKPPSRRRRGPADGTAGVKAGAPWHKICFYKISYMTMPAIHTE
jgi:hypothetical protein